MNSVIINKKAEVDGELRSAIKRLTNRGNLRALEIRWRRAVSDYYDITVPPLTGREVGNLKKMCGEYNDLWEFLEGVIRRWKIIRQQPNCKLLGPFPLFKEVFAFRHEMHQFLESERQRTLPMAPSPAPAVQAVVAPVDPAHSVISSPVQTGDHDVRQMLLDLRKKARS